MKNEVINPAQLEIGYYKINGGKMTRYWNGRYWATVCKPGSRLQKDWDYNRMAIQPTVKSYRVVDRPCSVEEISR